MRSWLKGLKRFILPLADAVSSGFHLADVGGQRDDPSTGDVRLTLRSLQEWISTNPCPDPSVRTQLEVVAGRYGFLALILETSNESFEKSELVALGDHLDATNLRLREAMAHMERGLDGEDPDDARD
jgi:hypothetical protein